MSQYDKELEDITESAVIPSDDVIQFVRDYTYAMAQLGSSADAERIMDMVISQRVHMRIPLEVEFLPEEAE